MAVIDGEALWTSTKLKSVPELFRAEYANLIPLANVHGFFEYDPSLVWRTVYGYNRSNVSIEDVRMILQSFVDAGMISIHDLGDKKYGYFVGIDKEGRLPAPSRRNNYKHSYPSPSDFEDYVVSK